MNTNTKVLAGPGGARGYFVNRMVSAAAAAVLTAAWLAAAQPAHASDYSVLTTTVKYGDLNLQSESGARTLYRRLQNAAERVCGPIDHRNRAWQECYRIALGDAVNSVGAPALFAVHRATRVAGANSG